MVVEIVTLVRSSSSSSMPTEGRTGKNGGGSAPSDKASSAALKAAELLEAAAEGVRRGGAEKKAEAPAPREEALRRRRIVDESPDPDPEEAEEEEEEEEHSDDANERKEASVDDDESDDEEGSGESGDGGGEADDGEVEEERVGDDAEEEEEDREVGDDEEEEEEVAGDDAGEEEEEGGGDDDEAAGDDDDDGNGDVGDNGDDDEAAGDDDDGNNNGVDRNEGEAQDDDDGDDDEVAKDDDEGQPDQHPNEGGGVVQRPRVQPRRSLEEVLSRAGVEVDPELRRELPPAEEAEWLYYGGGDGEAVVLGLDSCEKFRDTIKGEDRFIAVAGMFNTGTNLLSDLLVNNCYLPEKVQKFGEKKIGMRGQVPWGKHSPMSWRGHHVAEGGAGDVIQTDVLPAVVVKDPFTWMTSMCRHKYAANWHHTEGHCPNLVPIYDEEKNDEMVQSPEGGQGKTIPVQVKYRETKVTKHESLAGLWNDWYQPWVYEATFPRIIVRFEDLLLRAEEVVTTVCHCGGGEMREAFQYDVDTAKHGIAHKGANGMTSAIVRYTNATLRLEPYQERDLRYADEALRPDLMETFGYRYGVKRAEDRLKA